MGGKDLIGRVTMDRNEDHEYDYDRIRRDFQERARTADRSWAKGVVLGLGLGVMLCTGTAYAIYAGEMAYESAMEYGTPASPPAAIETDHGMSDAPRGGHSRQRRGHFRGPQFRAE
jgi:hypothetical protein